MIFIKQLSRPNRRSGFALAPGKSTKIQGVTITNTTKDVIYIDRFSGYGKRKSKLKTLTKE